MSRADQWLRCTLIFGVVIIALSIGSYFACHFIVNNKIHQVNFN